MLSTLWLLNLKEGEERRQAVSQHSEFEPLSAAVPAHHGISASLLTDSGPPQVLETTSTLTPVEVETPSDPVKSTEDLDSSDQTISSDSLLPVDIGSHSQSHDSSLDQLPTTHQVPYSFDSILSHIQSRMDAARESPADLFADPSSADEAGPVAAESDTEVRVAVVVVTARWDLAASLSLSYCASCFSRLPL